MQFDALADRWAENYQRDRIFKQRFSLFKDIVRPLEGISSVIDIGCGSGEYSAFLHERYHGRIVGVDISEKMVQSCRDRHRTDNLSFQTGDITRLEFANDCCDLAVSLSVLEWVEDYPKAIAEVSRVLKPGGKWIVSIPNWRSPFRMAERIVSRFKKSSYLRLQKNRLSMLEMIRLCEKRKLKVIRRDFHVIPFYGGRLPLCLGSIFGMMCILTFEKRTSVCQTAS